MSSQEQWPYLAYQPSLDAHAALVATSGVLIIAVAALAFHSRRVLFASLLATSLVFQSVSYAGMLVLRSSPDSHGAATAVLLGSLTGPAFAAAALVSALPLVAILGADDDDDVDGGDARRLNVRCASVGAAALARTLGVFLAGAVVVMAAGSGLVVQQRNTVVVVAGLVVELVAVVLFAAVNGYFTCKAVSRPLAVGKEYLPASASHSHYWLSQTRAWTVALNMATGILLSHLVYRIIEQSQGLHGALFASPSLSVFMDEVLPLIAIAVSTISPPSPSGSSMGGEMPAPAWPAYNDSSRSSSPSPVTDLEMEMGERGRTRHPRTATATCVSPVWYNSREKIPVITVSLDSGERGGRKEKKRKRNAEDMVPDDDELW